MPIDNQQFWAMLGMNPMDPAGVLTPQNTVRPVMVPMADQPQAQPAQATPSPWQALAKVRAPAQVTPQPSQEDEVMKQYKQLMEERLGGIKGMEKQIENIQNHPSFDSVNLKPLLAYGDQLGQTNFAQSYQAPASREEQVQKLKDAIAGQQAKASDDFLNLIKENQAIKQNEADQNYKNQYLDVLRGGLDVKDKVANSKLASSQGGMKIPANTVLKANEGNAIPAMLEDVSKVVKGNLDLFDPVRGTLASYNPYDARVQAVNSEMKAVSQAFGKYMEGGVLRKEDETKYRKMFPNVGDTPEVAQVKLDNVRRILIQKQNSDVSALRGQGYNTQGLERGFMPPPLNPLTVGGPANVASSKPAGGVLSPQEWLAQKRAQK